MAKVRSALEIALEKAGSIAALTPEERQKARDEERLLAVLREFYQGKYDSGGLWQCLQGSSPSLLLKAQINLINTFGVGIAQQAFQDRKQAILALETLKENQNTAVIEAVLNEIEALLQEYLSVKENAVEDLKRQIEAYPQLRMKPVRTANGKTVVQMRMSVDEAVKGKLSEFFAEQEGRFGEEFSALVESLKQQVQ